MKTLVPALLTEQKRVSVIPAVKIGIQSYGFPKQKQHVTSELFDWEEIDGLDLFAPIQAVSPSDGSVIVLDSASTYQQTRQGVSGGQIQAVEIINSGSGYTSAPTVTFGSVGTYGGDGATGIAIISGGSVVGVNIVSAGSRYQYPPSVTFTGGGGSGAVAKCALYVNGIGNSTIQLNDITIIDTLSYTYTTTFPYTAQAYQDVQIKISTVGSQDKFIYRIQKITRFGGVSYYSWGEWSDEYNCDIVLITLTLPPDFIFDYGGSLSVAFANITGHELGTLWQITHATHDRPEFTVILMNPSPNDFIASGTSSKFDGVVYLISVSTEGEPDSFQWLKQGDTGSDTEGILSAEIACSAIPILIDNEVYVAWLKTTGHTKGATWTIRSNQDYGKYKIQRYVNSETDSFNPVLSPSSPLEVEVAAQSTTSSANTSFMSTWTAPYRVFPVKANTIAITANRNQQEVITAAWFTELDTKIGGYTSITPSGTCQANRVYMQYLNYQGGSWGKKLQVRCTGEGDITIGLYYYYGGVHGYDLFASTSAHVVEGINIIDFDISGTWDSFGAPLWIAFNSTAPVVGYKTGTATRQYKDAVFDSLPLNFPSTGWITDNTAYDIIGVYTTKSSLKVRSSYNCGETWESEWNTIYTSPDKRQGNIALGMNDNGDIGLFSCLGYDLTTTIPSSISITRTNGVWATPVSVNLTETSKSLAWDDQFGWYILAFSGNIYNITGVQKAVDTTPSTKTLAEFMNLMNPLYSQYHNLLSRTMPVNIQDWNWVHPDEASFYKSHFKYNPNDSYLNLIPMESAIGEPFSWTMVDKDVFISLSADGNCYFIIRKGIDKIISSQHQNFNTVRNCILVNNGEWIIQVRDATMYYSETVVEWTVPQAGAGAGSEYNLLTTDIVGIKAKCAGTQAGYLIITFSNNDGAFNSPGNGNLSGLARGSRIDFYPGFLIDDDEITNEIQRFFVDSWSYSRSLNWAVFTLVCDDAWALLDKYHFPRPSKWNQFNDVGVKQQEYNIYQIIEMMIQTIGGTLTYKSRSDEITTIYPKIEINAGDTAGNVVLRMLNLVPDVIKWFGNDATIIYPQTTDITDYYYTGT